MRPPAPLRGGRAHWMDTSLSLSLSPALRARGSVAMRAVAAAATPVARAWVPQCAEATPVAPLAPRRPPARPPRRPPPFSRRLVPHAASADVAVARAYAESGLGPSDVHYWGLYDCFPVCFVRAVEAVGLAPAGGGGAWVERWYRRLFEGEAGEGVARPGGVGGRRGAGAAALPVNTHGGLLGFGAPWEVPAMQSLAEAVAQLRGEAHGRQVGWRRHRRRRRRRAGRQ